MSRKDFVFLVTVAALAVSFFANCYQATENDNLRHTIATQKRVIELLITSEDTIRFDCRHCGWSHNLSTNDTTQTNKKP